MASVTISQNSDIPHDPPLEEQIELLNTIILIMRAECFKWQEKALTLDLPPDKMELAEFATIQEGESDD